jgi:hypothetical protein
MAPAGAAHADSLIDVLLDYLRSIKISVKLFINGQTNKAYYAAIFSDVLHQPMEEETGRNQLLFQFHPMLSGNHLLGHSYTKYRVRGTKFEVRIP